MADPPRDVAEYEEPDPPLVNIEQFFRDAEDGLEWSNVVYEPSKPTRQAMLMVCRAYRKTHSKHLAAQSVGWTYSYYQRLLAQYEPFKLTLDAITNEIKGTVRKELVDAGVEGKSVAALIHLDKLLSADEYQAAERPPAPQLIISVSTRVPPGQLEPGAETQQIAERGVTDIEVPFHLPGVTNEPRPRWYEEPEPDEDNDEDEDDEDEDDEE